MAQTTSRKVCLGFRPHQFQDGIRTLGTCTYILKSVHSLKHLQLKMYEYER